MPKGWGPFAPFQTKMAPKGKNKGKANPKKDMKDPTSGGEDEKPDEATPALKKAKKEPQDDKDDPKKIGDKHDLDKMYQAMKYQAKKGNKHPLDSYSKLSTKAEKAEFFAKYLQAKKFDFLEIKEERSAVSEVTSKETEGWMSKYQIADIEKLPVDHPLMEKKLASLPSRAHSCKAWADEKELEYFYTGTRMTERGDKQTHGIKAIGKGTAKKDHADALLSSLASSSAPPKAIEDGPKPEKDSTGIEGGKNREDEEEEDNSIEEEWAEKKLALTKICKTMGDLSNEALTVQGALSHKPHLSSLMAEVANQQKIFDPARIEALGMLGTMSQELNQERMKEKLENIKNIIEQCNAHISGFKMGAFKEARALLKSA